MSTCNLAQAGFVARLADEYLEGILTSRALTHPFVEACLVKLMEVCCIQLVIEMLFKIFGTDTNNIRPRTSGKLSRTAFLSAPGSVHLLSIAQVELDTNSTLHLTESMSCIAGRVHITTDVDNTWQHTE